MLSVLVALAMLAAPADAQVTLTTSRVASGLSLPLFVTAPPGDTARVFIIEQRSGTTGRIRILNIPGNTLNATAYLSISPVATNDEEGLLGLAFHPDFLNNGYFWVYYTNSSGNNVIARYQANTPYATSTTANAASATMLLTISHPTNNNHNGGWMAFGPDGYLYVATGDGGSANDPSNNAQNINVLLGKLLRLDVDGADDIPGNDDDDGVIGMTLAPYTSPADNPFVGVAGDDRIWAYGLRNPWRDSFDRLTGDLYIGDVGQGSREEVDFQLASSAGGENYGWRCMEGNNCTGLSGCTCRDASLTLPIHEYTHAGGNCSITGGYVYRGSAIPCLQGTYFFADYCSNQIWSLRYDGAVVTELTNRTADLDPPSFAINSITSFGEDANGELYICDRGGEVFKIELESFSDCNSNGVADCVDIAGGTSQDCNMNGIPDECGGDGNPDITAHPQNQSACENGEATFSVVASGKGTLSYQWQRNGGEIPGATAATLQIDPVAAADAGAYNCVVTDSCGSATSSSATLTVWIGPSITQQPVDQSVCQGDEVSFTVAADGTAPLSYQWRKNGIPIPAGAGSSYMILSVAPSDVGTYDCVVSNLCGSATSSPASLTVDTCPGDANGDGQTENVDLQILLESWNSPNPDQRADFNFDGLVDNADLQILLDNWMCMCQ
jgi:hypothetical protein